MRGRAGPERGEPERDGKLTLDLEKAAEERLSQIDIFYLHLYIVYLSLGLLGTVKPTPWPQEGGWRLGYYLEQGQQKPSG